jgi:hypothetical protein
MEKISAERREFPTSYAGALQVLGEGISLGPWMGEGDMHEQILRREGRTGSRKNRLAYQQNLTN